MTPQTSAPAAADQTPPPRPGQEAGNPFVGPHADPAEGKPDLDDEEQDDGQPAAE